MRLVEQKAWCLHGKKPLRSGWGFDDFGLSRTFARVVRGTRHGANTRQETGGVGCVIRPLCPFERGSDVIWWLLRFHDIAAQRGDELAAEVPRHQPKRALEIRRPVLADLAKTLGCGLPLAIAKPLSRAP